MLFRSKTEGIRKLSLVEQPGFAIKRRVTSPKDMWIQYRNIHMCIYMRRRVIEPRG